MTERNCVYYRSAHPQTAYTFLYPADWRVREIGEKASPSTCITGPRNRAGTYAASFAVGMTRAVDQTPDEAAAALLASYRAAFNSQELGPFSSTVAGRPAVEVEVVYSMPLPLDSIHPHWTVIRQRSIFFKQGDQLYELDYAASEEDYQTWLPAFRALTRSFTFETEIARPALRRPAVVSAFPRVREDAPEYRADGSSSNEQPEQHGD